MTTGTPRGTRRARLGIGGGPLANLYVAGTDELATATVRAAYDAGIRLFDTAPHYGLGLAERRLGAALRSIPGAVDEVTVSTKVGRLLEPVAPTADPADLPLDDEGGFVTPATSRRVWDHSEAGLRRSLEASLERLDLDRVEVLYLHDPDLYDLEGALREGLPALVRLREEGLVDRVGVGANDEATLARCVEAADLDEVMCAGRFTLLEQPALTELFPACARTGTTVVAAGVYNSGLLATEALPDHPRYDYEPAPAAVVERLRRLHEVCRAHGTTVPVAAVQLVRSHPQVSAVVLGARTPQEVADAVARADAGVPAGLWSALVDAGLLVPEAVAA